MQILPQQTPWIADIYRSTRSLWEEIGKPKRGYVIFFSPVRQSPKLMIIGENPAGYEGFMGDKVSVPPKHEYEHENYPMANRMRSLFSRDKMKEVLFESVKLNLNFFASKNVSSLENKEYHSQTEKFSHKYTIEIIQQLQPKIILTEGLRAFYILKDDLGNGSPIVSTISHGSRRLLCKGEAFDGINILGIPHPGSRGVTAEMREAIGQLLKIELSR